MCSVVQQRVKYRLDRQDVNSRVSERGKAGGGVGGASRAHGIAEHGDLQPESESAEGSLVDADWSFHAAEQKVLYSLIVQVCGDRFIGECGEGVFGKYLCIRREFAKARVGRAEFGWDLLAENHRYAQAAGGGERESGTGAQGRRFVDAA